MPAGAVTTAFALANALGCVLLVLAWRRRRRPSGPALVVLLVAAAILLVALSTTRLFDRGTVAYREVFVAMRDPALIVGPDGRLIDANPAARRRLAVDDGDLGGAALLTIAPQLESARRHGVTVDALLERADTRMYRDKQGRSAGRSGDDDARRQA